MTVASPQPLGQLPLVKGRNRPDPPFPRVRPERGTEGSQISIPMERLQAILCCLSLRCSTQLRRATRGRRVAAIFRDTSHSHFVPRHRPSTQSPFRAPAVGSYAHFASRLGSTSKSPGLADFGGGLMMPSPTYLSADLKPLRENGFGIIPWPPP